MNDPSSHDLLGYMLGVLDDGQHEQMERLIESDPGLKQNLEEIRQQVSMLDVLVPGKAPPAGLARRTCEKIAAQSDAPTAVTSVPTKASVSANSTSDASPQNHDHAKPRTVMFRDDNDRPVGRSSISKRNILAIVVVLALIATVVLPTLNHIRFQSRMLACQDNIRTLGFGLQDYADHHGGKYVPVSSDGDTTFAGIFGPVLLDAGFVSNRDAFYCPGVSNDRKPIPTLQDLAKADPTQLFQLQARSSGDYSSALGPINNGVQQTIHRLDRPNFILLADNADRSHPNNFSSNHAGKGQNVFFEDGRIQFLSTTVWNGDDIFTNDYGDIGPAAHPDDIVLVPSLLQVMKTHVE